MLRERFGTGPARSCGGTGRRLFFLMGRSRMTKSLFLTFAEIEFLLRSRLLPVGAR